MIDIDTRPVFRNVGQALHVSFLMEELPVTQKTSTQALIRILREAAGKPEQRQGNAAGTLNFAGLSPLEVRGQCAMVRAAAHDHLTRPEFDAVRARYGRHLPSARVFTRRDGIRGIADYASVLAGLDHDEAMLACTTWFYVKPARIADRFELQDVAREYGLHINQCKAAIKAIRKVTDMLEKRADARLHTHFVATGLVEDESNLTTA